MSVKASEMDESKVEYLDATGVWSPRTRRFPIEATAGPSGALSLAEGR